MGLHHEDSPDSRSLGYSEDCPCTLLSLQHCLFSHQNALLAGEHHSLWLCAFSRFQNIFFRDNKHGCGCDKWHLVCSCSCQMTPTFINSLCHVNWIHMERCHFILSHCLFTFTSHISSRCLVGLGKCDDIYWHDLGYKVRWVSVGTWKELVWWTCWRWYRVCKLAVSLGGKKEEIWIIKVEVSFWTHSELSEKMTVVICEMTRVLLLCRNIQYFL